MHNEHLSPYVSPEQSGPGHRNAELAAITPPVLLEEERGKAEMQKASQMQIEAAKILLSSSIDFVKGTTQVLQAFTSLLVTAYIALLVGVIRNSGLHDLMAFAVALLPLALWVASLAAGYLEAVSYQGSALEFDSEGNPVDALETYERVIRDRRRHLILPSALTLIGIFFFVVSLWGVLLPNHP